MAKLIVLLAVLGVVLAGCESAPPDVKVSGEGVKAADVGKAKAQQKGKTEPYNVPD